MCDKQNSGLSKHVLIIHYESCRTLTSTTGVSPVSFLHYLNVRY